MRKFLFYWGPVIAWMAVIFFLSGRHSVQISPQFFLNFLFYKTLHVLEYSFLYLLWYRAIANVDVSSLRRESSLLAFCLVILYAISDEMHQLFVPTREGRVRDVIIDAGGAMFAWILIKHLLPKAPKKLKHLANRWQIPF